MNLNAKQELTSTEHGEEIITKVVGYIVQVYGAIDRYLQGGYPNFSLDPAIKNLHPIIVSLEHWYLFIYEWKELHKKVEEGLVNSRISVTLLKKYPYSLMSTNELEQVAQVIHKVETNELFVKKIVIQRHILGHSGRIF